MQVLPASRKERRIRLKDTRVDAKLSVWRAYSKQLNIPEEADKATAPVDFDVVGGSARPRVRTVPSLPHPGVSNPRLITARTVCPSGSQLRPPPSAFSYAIGYPPYGSRRQPLQLRGEGSIRVFNNGISLAQKAVDFQKFCKPSDALG